MRQKRFLSWLVIFALLAGMFSLPAFADGDTTTITQDTTSGTMTITLLVKGTPAAPAAPTLASAAKNSITLNTVDGCEYSMDGASWQDSPEFTGLSISTAYTFYQRLGATDTMNPSPASAGASFSTTEDTYGMTITLVIEPTITGAELALEGTPKLRFHVTMPGGLDYSESYMRFSIHGRTADIPIAKAGTAAGNVRTFDCPVYSIEMAEPVTAVFHYKENDVDKTATLTNPISVKDYLALADEQYPDNTKLRALTDAARDYGHYMQLYLAELHGFTVGTDDETYTYDYQTMPNASEITALTGLDDYKTQWNNSSPDTSVLKAVGYYDTFNETTTLNILFRVANGTGTITATADGETRDVEYEDEQHVAFGSNTYRIRIPDIAANNLDHAYRVQLSADGNTFCDMDVSALTYVSTMLANGSPTLNEAKALTALYNYNVAADAYTTPTP